MKSERKRSLELAPGHARARSRVAAIAGFVLALLLAAPVGAKTPGKTYCFNGVCHYVKTIAETRAMVGRSVSLVASHYDSAGKDRYNPSNLTASGEYFRSWTADNAASPIYPNGTKLLVWNPSTKAAVVVRINNAGPYWGNRTLDLSRAAAQRLGMGGIATLQTKVLAAPTESEARYQKGRTYASVPGYIGTYASLSAASSSVGGGSAPKVAPATAVAEAKPKPAPAKPAPARVAVKPAPVPAKPAPVTTAKVETPPKPQPVRTARAEAPVKRQAAAQPSAEAPKPIPQPRPVVAQPQQPAPVRTAQATLAKPLSPVAEREAQPLAYRMYR
jgi:rare lipoprotein A